MQLDGESARQAVQPGKQAGGCRDWTTGGALMAEPVDCQVVHQSRLVLEDARRLAVSMKRLRRMLRACRTCEQGEACPLLQDINAQFNEALQIVMDQWQLRAPYE